MPRSLTKAVLKLVAKLVSMAVALCGFAHYSRLEKFMALARTRPGGNLSAFEVMWPAFYQAAVRLHQRLAPLSTERGAYGLIEVSASDETATGHFGCTDSERLDDLVYGCVAEYGGSISAEHGIGLQKRAYLSLSRSPAELAFMRSLKAHLDPAGIINPGKVLSV